MKELTKTYGVLLQDKRVKSEQAKYEGFTRQRNSVLTRYKKVFQAFNDLIHGLMNAQSFYSEMRDTVESLEKNVETFVSNRRSEGAQLLHRIEQEKVNGAGNQADRERDRLQQLMERMTVEPSSASPTKNSAPRPASRPNQPNDLYSSKSPPISPPYYSKPQSSYSNGPSIMKSPITPASYENFPRHSPMDQSQQVPAGRDMYRPQSATPGDDPQYNPMAYPYQSPASPPPPHPSTQSSQYTQQSNQFLPQGYMPPPPPPGPPPSSQGNFGNPGYPYPSGPGGYAQPPKKHASSQPQSDPWAGLNAWK